MTNITANYIPIGVPNPSGGVSQSTYSAVLDVLNVSDDTKSSHILSTLASGSLYSIGELCDDGCLALFSKTDCWVFKEGKLVIWGKRTKVKGLWHAVKEHTLNKLPQPLQASLATYAVNNLCPELGIKARVHFLHAALFCPPISTFCQALDYGSLASFSGGITSQQVRKHLFFSEVTHMGHLDQERQGLRSTKIQPEQPVIPLPTNTEDIKSFTEEDTKLFQECTNPAQELHCKKFFAQVIQATGKIYSDPMGQFILLFVSGTNYMLCVYAYDTN